MTAVLACKLCRSLIRLLGRGGTDFPGRVALKLCPNLLGELAKNVTTVIVTGTNGKTTTSRMIEQSWQDAGISYFANKSGANLLSGVTAEFAVHSTLTGRCKYPYALIEADEAALKFISEYVDAKVIVFTNVFRDQLDRYGEVMHTRDNILAGLKNSPHAQVLLNADCSITASLAAQIDNPVSYYGVDCEIYPRRVPDLSDATHCIKCGAPYEYDYTTYAHLGSFRCPECGYRRPQCSVAVEEIVERGTDSCMLRMRVGEESSLVRADVPADYDIYNCAAAVAALTAFGLPVQEAFAAMGSFKHGFGRGEVFDLGGAKVRLMLMKNPAGCNQIINLLLNEPDREMGLCAILNDQDCDGTDVSWIYDAAWEALAPQQAGALCSGDRAEDMALRLKYAGMPAGAIAIEKDYDKLIDRLAAAGHNTTVVANYSSMMEFRKHIAARLGLAGFWEG